MLQAAQAAGASWIGVVGLPSDSKRLNIAETLGASTTYSTGHNTAETIRNDLNNLGADVVLEAAGTPDGMSLAVDVCQVGGTVIYSGLPPQKIAPIEAIRVTRDELTIRGVEGNLPDNRIRALRLISQGAMRATPIVTHSFQLEDANHAFETVASGDACKAVFRIDDAIEIGGMNAGR
jgi:threonine dehydrogenase-like Zn-dependent dehydrogenase